MFNNLINILVGIWHEYFVDMNIKQTHKKHTRKRNHAISIFDNCFYDEIK